MAAKAQPKDSAKTVGKLTTKTGEGTDDLVLVLARTTDDDDQVWLKVRLPIRPNGTTGWVKEDALSSLQPVDTWLRISTKTYRATLIKKGRKVFSAPIGVGQNQWPTPKGQFYIRAKLTGYGTRSTGRSRSSPARPRTRSPTGRAAGSSASTARISRG